MIAAASECRVSLPPVIEYDADRADLPLVVVPVSIPSMTTLLRDRLDEFAGLARVRIHTDWTDDEDVLAARMSDATVVMSTGFRASARLLERIAGRVRCITFCGTGAVSFIDLDAARRLGITICNAVHYGDIAAAIDVTAPEPLPDDDPLRTLPNLIITPHVAWRSDRALAALVEQNVRSAVEFLKGGAYNVLV